MTTDGGGVVKQYNIKGIGCNSRSRTSARIHGHALYVYHHCIVNLAMVT
jgi:hypothetical protein